MTRRARLIVAAVCLFAFLAPGLSRAAACDERIGQTLRITGTYMPTDNAYARTFVFPMLMDCGGVNEIVTVQRATGRLPVCEARQQVEVVGRLVWNKALVDGHFEINNPSSVVCQPATGTATRGRDEGQPTQAPPKLAIEQPAPVPTQAGSPARPEPPRVQAKVGGGTRVWVGRYQDSRGTGDVTLTLLHGESMVSGTWKLRTGGGGPVMGLLDTNGRRMQLRMENIAPECPGTFEGSADVSDTTLIATYRGKDCDGDVTGGRLELRAR